MSRAGWRGIEKGSEASFRPFKSIKDDAMRVGLQREVAADERGDGLLVVNGGDTTKFRVVIRADFQQLSNCKLVNNYKS